MAKSTSRFVYVTAAIAAINGALFGYDTGVISGALLYIKQDFALSSFAQELVVSGVLAGAVVGAAIGGNLADRFGRRRLILITAAIFFLGALWMAFSPSVASLVAARIVVGTAIGMASFVGPLYISETAPARIRGLLVSLNQLASYERDLGRLPGRLCLVQRRSMALDARLGGGAGAHSGSGDGLYAGESPLALQAGAGRGGARRPPAYPR